MSRDHGPLRSESLGAYLLSTRVLAGVAALALAVGVVSDAFDDALWRGHALLAGLVSSVLVVMLSAGIFNEAVERRKRRRWSVLAQYVMLDLVRNVRMIWTGVILMTDLLPFDVASGSLADVGAPIAQDTDRLTPALASVVADPGRRRALHDKIAVSVTYSDQLLGRWAAVMLNADLYAQVIDRHVELASNIAWLGSLLDVSLPPEDPTRHHLARASAAVQIEGEISDPMLVDRLVVIVQLAEELDRGTLALALRLVPLSWWQARLGTAASPSLRSPGADG